MPKSALAASEGRTQRLNAFSAVLTEWLRKWARLHSIGREPIELTEEDFAVYAEALSDLSVEHLDAACLKAEQTCRFFPKPADIRAEIDEADASGFQIEGEQKWQQYLAWLHKWYDPNLGVMRGAPPLEPAVEHAAQAAGGHHWVESCPEQELQWAGKRFTQTYTRLQETRQVEHLLTRGEARKILAGLTARAAEQNARLLAPPAVPEGQSDAPPDSDSQPKNSGPPKAVIPKFEPLPPVSTEDPPSAPLFAEPKPYQPPSEEEFERRKREQRARLDAYLREHPEISAAKVETPATVRTQT